jgi:lysophospholipase L1-like esterase
VWNYLHYGDNAAFLHPGMNPRWQERIAYLDAAVDYISDQLKPTGARLVVAYAPAEVEGYLIADKMQIPNVDGEALARTVGAIAERHGAIFADGASAFQGIKGVQDYFYRADGHLNGAGHEVFGDAVAGAVISAKSSGYCAREAAR